MPVPEREAVEAHLAKVLSSSGFAKADRLSRFLRFTVRAKLNGEDVQIKESVLGREVFDRAADYDPRTDPIVRVEARRLRDRLEAYYTAAGVNDDLRIEFPKGSYVPVITLANGPVVASNRPSFPWKRRILAIAGVFVLLAACVGGYRILRPAPAELYAVMPATWLWGEAADPSGLEERIAEQVSIELADQRVARVVGWPLMRQYRTAQKEFRQIAAEVGANKVLLIRNNPKSLGVFVLDGASGEKVGFQEYNDSHVELVDAIVKRVAALQQTSAQKKR